MNRSISVVIATYNGSRYLQKQLDSVFEQTRKPDEVLVGDDGSSDQTIEILSKYESRLKIIRKGINVGFVRNFEFLIQAAKGDLIALCDQDDIWHPNKLKILEENIEHFDLIHSDARLIDGFGKVFCSSLKEYTNTGDRRSDPISILFHNTVTGCTALFKKSLKASILPFPNGIPYHDWWIAFVASKGNGIKYIPEQLVDYRQHLDNYSGISDSDLTSRIKLLIHGKVLIGKRYRDYKNNLFYYLSMFRQKNIKLTEKEIQVVKDLSSYYKVTRIGFNVNRLRIHIKYFNYLSETKSIFRSLIRLIICFLGL